MDELDCCLTRARHQAYNREAEHPPRTTTAGGKGEACAHWITIRTKECPWFQPQRGGM